MVIVLGADHRGYEWKDRLIRDESLVPHERLDVGAFQYDPNDDFNDAAVEVAKEVRENRGAVGILLCGSGDGMCIQANRFRGIRAARCKTVDEVTKARKHDDINVLCFAADELGDNLDLARAMINAFLTTDFDATENKVRRVNRLDEREDY